jgi:putative PIN family toxin of toxin-antitoxin system
LSEVLGREKFDAYVGIQDRKEFLRLLGRIVEMVPILHAIHDCRDVRDKHILEVAVNGQAQVIVTGDKDLLVLNPFRGIPIMRPASFLKWEISASSAS